MIFNAKIQLQNTCINEGKGFISIYRRIYVLWGKINKLLVKLQNRAIFYNEFMEMLTHFPLTVLYLSTW